MTTFYKICIFRGGLTLATEEFQENVQQMEQEFLRFHGNSLSTVRNPIEKLTKIIMEKNICVPRDIAFLYAKTRLFIRMKFLNDQLNVTDKYLQRRYVSHINKMR